MLRILKKRLNILGIINDYTVDKLYLQAVVKMLKARKITKTELPVVLDYLETIDTNGLPPVSQHYCRSIEATRVLELKEKALSEFNLVMSDMNLKKIIAKIHPITSKLLFGEEPPNEEVLDHYRSLWFGRSWQEKNNLMKDGFVSKWMQTKIDNNRKI